MRRCLPLLPLVLFALAAPLAAAPLAPRAGALGAIVSACSAAGLAASLAGSDYLSFDCGEAPFTIRTGELTVVSGRSVTIDGGGLATLSGGEANRLFTVEAGARLTLLNITLAGGAAPSGGAILNRGELSLAETTLSGNRATSPEGVGGAIENRGGLVQIVAGALLGNQAAGRGGAIANLGGEVTLVETLVERNRAVAGGGISSDGALTLRDSSLLQNLADGGAGGAVAIFAGDAEIAGSALEDNLALFGGGLFVGGDAGTRVTLTDSLVRDNRSYERFPGALGGGIHSGGELLVERTTVAGNSAANGGGLLQVGDNGRLTVRASTFSANTAAGTGGGLILRGGAGHELTNVTVSGNSAGSLGGGLYAQDLPATLRHLTLANNGAPLGANLYTVRGSPALQAVILAAPRFGPNCGAEGVGAPLLSLGANMADDGSCPLDGPGDRSFADLVPGDLADNGGPTLTHLPAAGSPAVDAAPVGGCPPTDQRGLPRPAGAQCDSGATEVGAAPAPDAPPLAPYTPPGAPRATIGLTPGRGAAGARITVAGQAPVGAGGVLIATVAGGRTIVGAAATLSAARAYSVDLTIPPGLAPGPAQVCAMPQGLAAAALACATLTVEPMPAAQLRAESPLIGGGGARLQLFGPDQRLAYSAPVGQGGAAQLAGLSPGVYRFAISGQVSAPVGGGIVELRPGAAIDISARLGNVQTCADAPAAWVSGELGLRPPPPQPTPPQAMLSQYAGATIAGTVLTPNDAILGQLNGALRRRVESDTFGLYVQGVQTWVRFRAYPQSSGAVERVIFRFYGPDGAALPSPPPVGPPFELPFDVGALPARLSPERMTSMTVTPVVGGQEQRCAPTYRLNIVPNPLARPGVQPAPYSRIAMDYGSGLYRFSLSLPHVPGLLPWSLAFRDLPLFPDLENRLNVGVQTNGTIAPDGLTTIESFQAINDVYLLNNQLLGPYGEQPLQVLPAGANGSCASGPLRFGLDRWGEQRFFVRYADLSKEVGIKPVRVPILPLFGVAEVAVRAGGSNTAGVLIAACLAPMRPEASLVLEPFLQKKRTQGLDVTLLSGVSQVGAELISDEKAIIPLSAQLIGGSPGLKTPDLCVRLNYALRAWFKPPLLKTLEETVHFPQINQCVSDLPLPFQVAPTPPPETLAEPAVAAAPDGRALAAYVEQAPGEERAQVLVRLRAPGSTEWGAPVALSSPLRAASSPAVAFAGPDATPLAVWVESTLDATEAAALGENLGAILSRQELFYSAFAGGAWSAPARLTDDALADGLPVLAGGPAGAVLAWVRDGDGDAATRRDQRIAARLLDPATGQFGPLSLLGAEGLNGDVAAAYSAAGAPYLAWAHDADGDLRTADDRRLAVAGRVGGAWSLLNTGGLPARVDSPAISAGPDGVRLAFLVREPAPDGGVPLLGANGALWSARSVFTSWSAAPLLDEAGAQVYGERPVLAQSGDEALLLLRRFGESGVAELGQLALAQARPGLAFGPPLALTDAPEESWLPALALDPLTRRAVILKATRGSENLLAARAEPLLGAQGAVLSAAAGPLDVLELGAAADPALESLAATPRLPRAGTLVQVRVVVRNLGRNPAEPLVVTLYRGEPGSGQVLAARPLDGPLAFGAAQELAFAVTADGGELPLYAQVSGGENALAANDRAGVLLGRPSAPAIASVGPESGGAGVVVAWRPAASEEPLGYRVLRGAAPGEPLALVGESLATEFVDTQVAQGQTACYAVQAYTAASLGPQSAVVCGASALERIYLPMVRR